MKRKVIAGLAFLLNTFLFGTYYSVSKEALGHIDPIVFTFFVMMTLVPPAILLIAFSWRHITREIVRSGFLLGSCLCLGLFSLSVALKYNTATGTAFFPALNGLLAAIVTWLFLRQPIHKTTWLAGIISVAGAILLMANSSMGGLRGSAIAFIGGLLCTLYIFLADREQRDKTAYWSLFGVELLTMALWANLIALLFGDWQTVHLSLPSDGLVILYIGLGTTLLPTLFTVLLQKYISPVTVSFIYILEPIFGAIVANLYLHEVLPLSGYVGGALVVAGVLLHTWGAVERPNEERLLHRRLSLASRRLQTSLPATLIYPLLCCGIGIFVVYRLGGFPPTVWRDLFRLGPQLPAQIQQGHGRDVFLLVAQALSWLIAWVSLIIMGGLASYRAFRRLFSPTPALDLDVRALRQMGVTPYSVSPARNRGNKSLVERRRRNRRIRLARVEEVNAASVYEVQALKAEMPIVPRYPLATEGIRLPAASASDDLVSHVWWERDAYETAEMRLPLQAREPHWSSE